MVELSRSADRYGLVLSGDSPTLEEASLVDGQATPQFIRELNIYLELVAEITKALLPPGSDPSQLESCFAPPISFRSGSIVAEWIIPDITPPVIADAHAQAIQHLNETLTLLASEHRQEEAISYLTTKAPRANLRKLSGFGASLASGFYLTPTTNGARKATVDSLLSKQARTQLQKYRKQQRQDTSRRAMIVGTVLGINNKKNELILNDLLSGVSAKGPFDPSLHLEVLRPYLTDKRSDAKRITAWVDVESAPTESELSWVEKPLFLIPLATPRMRQMIDTIGELSLLQAGWLDGEGEPIARRPLMVATYLSSLLDRFEVSAPHVVPTPLGGVSLVWRDNSHRADVTIEDDDLSVSSLLFKTAQPYEYTETYYDSIEEASTEILASVSRT